MASTRHAPGPIALAALALAGCSSGLALSVDLRTDFAPGTEITGVKTTIDGTEIDHVPSAGEPWPTGARVADLSGLAPGTHHVTVALYAAATLVAQREVAVSITTSYAVTVVITHACAGVTCPRPGDPASATTCVNGTCASPSCGSAGQPACPGCTTDATCAPARVTCATATCAGGACLDTPHDDRCPFPEKCDLALGCTGVPADGGVVHDGGMHLDAGRRDAGTPTDGGPLPCEPDCHGRECGPDPLCGESCGADCTGGATCDATGSCVCPSMRTYCGGTCVDTGSDGANCGGCGQTCIGGTCIGGVCNCPGALTPCPGGCFDLQTDSRYCGSCTTACNIFTGPACCAGTCTSFNIDDANCGTCGHACAVGQTCMGAVCM